MDGYIRFCREVGAARLTRREIMKLGLLSAGTLLATKAARAASGSGSGERSPPVTPFKDPLPMPGVHRPVAQLDPRPPLTRNRARANSARRGTRPLPIFRRGSSMKSTNAKG